MFAIIVGLVALMAMAYIGWSILWIAPVAAAVVALLSGMNVFDAFTSDFMSGFASFARDFFPVFLFGAIFGKLMEVTGSARTVAQFLSKIVGKERAILGVLLGAAILTYGGVSLFVVVFVMYPLSLNLFRQANISRKVIPGTIVLGAFTFTMTALPGTAQVQNYIPTEYFDTTMMAAPIMGTVTGLIMAVGGYFYLSRRANTLTKNGEVFTEPKDAKKDDETKEKDPNIILSFLPLLTVVVLINVVDMEMLTALLVGIVLSMVLSFQTFKRFTGAMNEGAKGAVTAVVNTGAAVGFGAVVQAAPAFPAIQNSLLNIKGGLVVSDALATQVLAMITGSASGGMNITLNALGSEYYQQAMEMGMNPEILHRITALASGASILPHNGALLTVLAITGMTHKDSYKDIFFVAFLIPTIALAVGIGMSFIGIV
ncbi:GntP family permease [Jeotgalibacillus proteolyticus]|uniref:GntP family permease n=1 Tax=Jeotgalibacillus proteolyticus TaxID=2082395 RepID=UPI003CEE5320